MPRIAIHAPLLHDLSRVGLRGQSVVIASAFYTSGPLNELEIDAKNLDLLVRLNLSSPHEWVLGSVAPDALLEFARRQIDSGCKVKIRVSADAHAKIYWGEKAFLVGSANLTTRGLGGSVGELLWFESYKIARSTMRRVIDDYANSMTELSIAELERYVMKHEGSISALRGKLPPQALEQFNEARLPRVRSRPKRFGAYINFLDWLRGQSGAAAEIVLNRANGAGNLSGHIHRNFYGIRQFLLAHPRWMRSYLKIDPASYSFLGDPGALEAVSNFVCNEVVDEGSDFSVSTWRTYLPRAAGGNAVTGGGTSGNLNRMLPLIARYLAVRIR